MILFFQWYRILWKNALSGLPTVLWFHSRKKQNEKQTHSFCHCRAAMMLLLEKNVELQAFPQFFPFAMFIQFRNFDLPECNPLLSDWYENSKIQPEVPA